MKGHCTAERPDGRLPEVQVTRMVVALGPSKSSYVAELPVVGRGSGGISLAVIALVSLLCPSPAEAQPTDALAFEAIRTAAVPAGFDVNGAALLPDGTPVVWGSPGVFVLGDTGNEKLLESLVSFQPRGLRIVDSRVPSFEVLGPAGELMTLGSNPDSSRLHVPRKGFEIVQSAFFRDGWFVLTEADQDESGPDQLWFLSQEALEGEPPFPLPYSRAKWQRSVHLTTTGHEVLVTEIGAPFRTWRVRPFPEDQPREVRAELIHEEGLVSEQLAALAFPEERTVALRAMRLDRGYLLQLSELSEDRRLIILLDDRGNLIRSSIIDAAIGFMVSEPNSRLLLAFRDIGRQEFVLYRWTWGGRD